MSASSTSLSFPSPCLISLGTGKPCSNGYGNTGTRARLLVLYPSSTLKHCAPWSMKSLMKSKLIRCIQMALRKARDRTTTCQSVSLGRHSPWATLPGECTKRSSHFRSSSHLYPYTKTRHAIRMTIWDIRNGTSLSRWVTLYRSLRQARRLNICLGLPVSQSSSPAQSE